MVRARTARLFFVDSIRVFLTILVILHHLMITMQEPGRGRSWHKLVEYVPSHVPELTNASIGVLWFVEALLIFSAAYVLVWLVSKAGGARRDAATVPVPSSRVIALFALLLGLTTFVVRTWAPMG